MTPPFVWAKVEFVEKCLLFSQLNERISWFQVVFYSVERDIRCGIRPIHVGKLEDRWLNKFRSKTW